MIGNRKHFDRLPGGGYSFDLRDENVRIEFRQLRREHHSLVAEVDVLCDWAGAKTYGGSLSRADLNLSSQTARVARGKHCAVRANSSLTNSIGSAWSMKPAAA
jgi:hypothetical protein